MSRLFHAVMWLLLLPGQWVADKLDVPQRNNRELVRMLVNYVFWFGIAFIGLMIWTATLPIPN
jgi:hypothetical protein